MPTIRHIHGIAALLLSIMGLAPCLAKADPAQACLAEAASGLESHWKALCASPAKDLTLHRMRAAQAAFTYGHDEAAASQFDHVLEAIEAIYADTESAAKARSVWHSEGQKDFKGEPFERVMAYYYRGLLYLRAGDWDNAQASFKGGVLQDTFAEQERFQADTASLVWLEGWARKCRGATSAADELFAEAARLRPGLTPPPAEANFLVVAESGTGPQKSRGGRHGEKLLVREGDRGGEAATAVLGRQRSKMAEAEDLFFQATTRGGRAVDGILAEKASTKTATTTAGVAAMTAGIGMTQGAQSSRDSRSSGAGYSATERAIGAAGGIVTLVGLLAVAASSGMDASADTRTWDTLPHSLYLAALVKPADFEPKSFDLQDNSGRSMLAARDAVRFNLRQGCSMAWVGSGNILLPTVAEPSPPVLPETGKPNCRTSAGTHRVLPSDVCLRIGGTVAE